mmetsp:Transcript_112978/g.326419  ORF Transcript_112978/g.326419 Transcript_112978/m.326419 type:complete len:244 (+) Transcript_112978:373-1104(+)
MVGGLVESGVLPQRGADVNEAAVRVQGLVDLQPPRRLCRVEHLVGLVLELARRQFGRFGRHRAPAFNEGPLSEERLALGARAPGITGALEKLRLERRSGPREVGEAPGLLRALLVDEASPDPDAEVAAIAALEQLQPACTAGALLQGARPHEAVALADMPRPRFLKARVRHGARNGSERCRRCCWSARRCGALCRSWERLAAWRAARDGGRCCHGCCCRSSSHWRHRGARRRSWERFGDGLGR